MFPSRTTTALVLLAIPVALFSLFQREDSFIVSLTNATATFLIFFAWRAIKKLNASPFDLLLLKTYLLGLLDFAACLQFNSTVRTTYEGAVAGKTRDAAFRSYSLIAVPVLTWCGLALAVLFTVLCLVRIFTLIRDHRRHTRSLKVNNV